MAINQAPKRNGRATSSSSDCGSSPLRRLAKKAKYLEDRETKKDDDEGADEQNTKAEGHTTPPERPSTPQLSTGNWPSPSKLCTSEDVEPNRVEIEWEDECVRKLMEKQDDEDGEFTPTQESSQDPEDEVYEVRRQPEVLEIALQNALTQVNDFEPDAKDPRPSDKKKAGLALGLGNNQAVGYSLRCALKKSRIS